MLKPIRSCSGTFDHVCVGEVVDATHFPFLNGPDQDSPARTKWTDPGLGVPKRSYSHLIFIHQELSRAVSEEGGEEDPS